MIPLIEILTILGGGLFGVLVGGIRVRLGEGTVRGIDMWMIIFKLKKIKKDQGRGLLAFCFCGGWCYKLPDLQVFFMFLAF